MSKFCKMVLMMLVLVALISWAVTYVQATALSAGRNTLPRAGVDMSLTMASNVIIYAGSMVCVDSSGKANPAADTSGFAVVGRADETVDNRTAVYVATKKIKVARGVFRWENADSIVAADIGKIVYVTDDQTVNKTGGGQNIIAGAVIDVDSSGVWVDTAKIGPIGAATPSSLAVSGAATIGTTLTVTGAGTMSTGLTVHGVATLNDGGVFTGTFSGNGRITMISFSNAAGKVFCYTNICTDATVSGLLDTVLMSNAAAKVFCKTGTIDRLELGTTLAIGAQSGMTYVITNKFANYTNFLWVGKGVITNVTLEGALP